MRKRYSAARNDPSGLFEGEGGFAISRADKNLSRTAAFQSILHAHSCGEPARPAVNAGRRRWLRRGLTSAETWEGNNDRGNAATA